jgi:hypothetical protein
MDKQNTESWIGMELGAHTFPSGKSYAYVRTPRGERVFLRNILFLHNANAPHQIVLVHEFGKRTDKAAWEPPKGQMEWKEFGAEGVRRGEKLAPKSLERHQRAGVLRELTEEAKILPSEIKGLTRLPLVYKQPWPESGLKNASFLYQYWRAETTPTILLEAQKRLTTLKTDKDLKAMLPPDNVEKDAVMWWSPSPSAARWDCIYGDFSKKMTQLYFKTFEGHHDV